MMHLSGLFLYPVKSLRGFAVTDAAVDELGLVGDRRFLVIDETGRFLTQRSHPMMACISTALTASELILSRDGTSPIAVRRESEAGAPLRTVSVWKSEGLLAEDCGDNVAGWLSAALQTKCRLVRAGREFLRPMLKPAAHSGDRVSFADAFPFLIISEASLSDLNDRIVADGGEALPMDRFRPNFVVTGCSPYAEDAWARFSIGKLEFRAGGPCARCTVTTTDQITAARGKEPLRTLGRFRRDVSDPTDVNFGQNLIHESKSGNIRVGDPVRVEIA